MFGSDGVDDDGGDDMFFRIDHYRRISETRELEQRRKENEFSPVFVNKVG